jgi:hypothetical protein
MEPIDRLPSSYRDWGAGSTYGRQAAIFNELRARVVIWPPPSTCPVAPRARIRSCRVARRLPWLLNLEGAGNENQYSRCPSIIRPSGHSGKWETLRCRKVDLEHSRLLQFARKLKPDDEIVIEATGNTSAIVRLLSPFVGRVVIANPILVRAIAWAATSGQRSPASSRSSANQTANVCSWRRAICSLKAATEPSRSSRWLRRQ